MILTDEERQSFFKYVDEARSIYSKKVLRIQRCGSFGRNIDAKKEFDCGVGYDSAVLTPNLKAYPCLFLSKSGNEIGFYENEKIYISDDFVPNKNDCSAILKLNCVRRLIMKISLATNFDDELIEKVKEYPIYEVYGKLNEDIIGGGRPSNYLKNLNVKKFENHVKKVRSYGCNFNYLLNSACLANYNQDETWVKNVIKFLSYLKSININALTITNPYLVDLVKRNFGNDFIIRVSSFACIDNYEKAKFWDQLGVDIICVDFCKVNRNFKMLKYMVDNLNCKIELLCTNSCLKDCPMIHTHVNDIAHASNSNFDGRKYEDWGLNFCQEYQLNNLYEYIKSPWIRPEDIHYYESIGIEHFKITERDFTTDELVKRVKAYCERKYSGNLLDLIQGSGASTIENIELIRKKNFNNRNEIVKEIQRVRGIGCLREAERHVFIDNKKIPNDFISHFAEGKCTGLCDKCNYCKKISDVTISSNDEVCSYLKFLYKEFNSKKFNM